MLNFVRQHQRWLQFILLLLILPAFVLTGVATFGGGSHQADAVASVGSRTITQQEFSARYQRWIETQRQSQGDKFDADYYRQPQTQQAFLTQLLNGAMIDELVQSGHMTAGDVELQQALANLADMPKTAQGTIDVAAYKTALAQQGLTPAQHQAGLRTDLIKAQLTPAYSVVNLPFEIEFLKSFLGQMREVEIKPVDLTPYIAQVQVTPEQVQTYYNQHADAYSVADTYDVAYAEIPLNGKGAGATALTDDEIKSVFGSDATGEQLNAVRKDPNQSKAVIEKVVLKRRAGEIDALVAKTPQDLNAVAKSLNVPVQQAKGLTRVAGATTPTVFADAKIREVVLNANQAEAKTIAPVMALSNGHLLLAQVTAFQAAGKRPFEAVKAQIEQQLRTEGAVKLAAADVQKNLAGLSAAQPIGAPQAVTWAGVQNTSSALVAKAMSIPLNTLPALAVVTDKDHVSLLRVVKQTALSAEQLAQMGQWAQTAWGMPNDGLVFSAYMAALRERMGAKIYPERLKIEAQP